MGFPWGRGGQQALQTWIGPNWRIQQFTETLEILRVQGKEKLIEHYPLSFFAGGIKHEVGTIFYLASGRLGQ